MHDTSKGEGAFDDLFVIFTDQRTHVEAWLAQAKAEFPDVELSLAVVQLLKVQRNCSIPNEEIGAIGWIVDVLIALARVERKTRAKSPEVMLRNGLDAEMVAKVKADHCRKWAALPRNAAAQIPNAIGMLRSARA